MQVGVTILNSLQPQLKLGNSQLQLLAMLAGLQLLKVRQGMHLEYLKNMMLMPLRWLT